MKKLILVVACVVSGLTAWGQGTVNFANFAAGVDAPITNGLTAARAVGPAYSAQLYYAAAGAGNNISSYTPLAGPVALQSGAGAGYFLGGSKAIPGFAQGTPVSIIVAAFSTAQGADYATSIGAGGNTGYSRPVSVTLGGGVVPAPNLTGLQGFSTVPEPSTIMLGALGAAALLLRRRKK